ncbi:MAG: acyl-CoA dehydrogenase family protein [Deltaproteobacteria bacterium]|nr:acyl-CoA dehydrogenase family protein [Deltaproteobacteria bacterium]
MNLDDLTGWLPQLTEEELTVRDTVRKWVASACLPRIRDDFEHHRFHTGWIPELAAMGVLGAPIQGYGCAGISNVAYGLACAEVEYCDSGLRSFVSVQTSLAMFAIWKYGSEAQKQKWLPKMAAGKAIGCFGLTEPNHGSDPGSMKTRAEQDGDSWTLNGSKMWITNAQVADVAIVWAHTGGGPDSIRGFIVEKGTPGFAAHDIPHKLSMRASFTGSLSLQDVKLSEADRLPLAVGLKGPLGCLDNARFGVAWGVLGATRFCIERAIEYTTDREQFGVPIASKQLVQAPLADLASRYVQAALLSLHYGRLKDEKKLSPVQVSLLKRNNCRLALDAARTARELMGANGITGEYDVLRHANNLESVLTYEGTEQIHTLVIGRALTGEAAF